MKEIDAFPRMVNGQWSMVNGSLGGRQEYTTGNARQLLQQSGHFVVEPHFKAFVKFVDNKIANSVWADVAFFEVVVQATWCPKNYMRAYLF